MQCYNMGHMSQQCEGDNPRPEDAALDSPAPKYTARDATNRAIHRIATGQDPEHPVLGLGRNWSIMGEYLIKRRDQKPYIATRFTFANTPARLSPDVWELSFVAREFEDGRVEVVDEGIMPRSENY